MQSSMKLAKLLVYEIDSCLNEAYDIAGITIPSGCVELSSHCAQSLHIYPEGNAQNSYGW